ncbi:hypothetical protein COO60DRAFT_641802 [Scenedesmus sp. NREL 46B-D3]|nr:hypothetical protein COO60DRAFT_641802 [Scenedesmus sp. NREL 46B-D3]
MFKPNRNLLAGRPREKQQLVGWGQHRPAAVKQPKLAKPSCCCTAAHCGSINSILPLQHLRSSPHNAALHGSSSSSSSSTCLKLQHGARNAACSIACRSSSFNSSSSSSRSSSSSSSSGNPARDSVAEGLSILEADTWQQLSEVFYGYRGTPGCQHCYAVLLRLAEQLPEMQLQPVVQLNDELAAAAPAAGGNGAAGSQQPGLPGSDSSSSSGGSWEAAWQALHARGKVQTWSQLTRLRALVRDVLRAVQVQMHLYEPLALLDLAEAAAQLARPSQLWMEAWMAALLPHLKQLQLGQLARAGAALLACGGSAGKPWAGTWFAALQPHLPNCTSTELALVSLALQRWRCSPPSTWTQQFLQTLTPNMSAMGVHELLAVLGACAALDLKPSAAWLRGFEAASQQQLRSCSPGELALLLQGLSLLGHQPCAAAGGWLQQYLAAVDEGQGEWDVQSLGTMLSVLGQLEAGQEALQVYEGTSSTAASSGSGSGSRLLAALAEHVEPLIESTADPGALVKVLQGFCSLNFTPSDTWLDLLLDEAAEKISVNSRALRQQLYGISGGSDNSGFHSMLLDSSSGSATAGSSSGGGSSSNSSSWMGSSAVAGKAEEQQGEVDEPWLLQAGSYQPGRNINLARRSLESSWELQSDVDNSSSSRGLSQQPSQSSSSSGPPGWGSSGAAAPVAAGGAAPVTAVGVQALAASNVVVRQVLGLLSVVAAMEMPVERGWAADVMRSLQGHCRAVGPPEMQQLLALLEVFGPVLEPEGVDELLAQCHNNYSRLTPQDMLRLLRLLASSQTRLNSRWWQGLLSALQVQLPALTPAQLVQALAGMCVLGARPPQAWLASHEAALLNTNTRQAADEALNPQGWLLLLECYSQLMYRPSSDFEGVLERHCLGVLPELGAQALASLVSSAARLQLPLSPQVEDGIARRLEQVLPGATSEELQQLTQGLLLLEVQLPSPCLRGLCDAAQPHLATFSPSATCSLLQLLAVAGDFQTPQGWLAAALSSLQPQLPALDAPASLLLLQSLAASRPQPPAGFTPALQQRLLQLVHTFDAVGVAAVLQGLVACGAPPSAQLQEALARHIKKGLAQPPQGMGATPVWLCLESLMAMQQPPASPLLLDEVLHQVAQQLRRAGTASSRQMAPTLLPRLAEAITAGGVWGSASGYAPSPAFCSALCGATLEDPGRLPPPLWLDLLVRFGDLAAGSTGLGFRPGDAWCRVATRQVLRGWDQQQQQQQQQWSTAPAVQLAALFGALGRLQHVPEHLPGWPGHALQRLCNVMAGLDGHQLSVALLGVAQQQAMTEVAAASAAAAAVQGSGGMLGSSYLISSNSSTSTTSGSGTHSSKDKASSSSSSSSSSSLQSFTAARLQLLEAAEAATLPQLSSMDGIDLAVLAHALQQLAASPSPPWVVAWSAAAAIQLPGMSGQACVLLLSAAAAFHSRPDPAWVRLVLQRCQQHLPDLQLQELVALARSLQLLGYRLDTGAALRLARAGQARAAAPTSTAAAAAAMSVGLDMVGSGAGEEGWEAAARQGALLELQQTLARISGAM